MRKSEPEPISQKKTKIHPKPIKKQLEEPNERAEIIDYVSRKRQNLKKLDNAVKNLLNKKDELFEMEECPYQELDKINAQIKQLNKQQANELALIDTTKKRNPEFFIVEIKQKEKEEESNVRNTSIIF